MNGKRRKHDSLALDATPSSLPNATSAHPHTPSDDAKLESFVDMLFGGRLASILVCEKCKKVSVTYEDFNDLSLSIKPEDYVKERKRDRFKMFAKKLRFRPKELGIGPSPVQRASSVPASPVRRSMDMTPHDEVPVNEGPRRGSFDHPRPEGGSSEDEARQAAVALSAGISDLTPAFDDGGGVDGDDEKEKEVKGAVEGAVEPSKTSPGAKKGDVHFDAPQVEAHKEARKEEREHKEEKKEDPWNKLGRRVSVAMKMGSKNASKRLSRSMDRHRHGPREAETVREDEPASKEPSRPSSRRGAVDSGSEFGDQSDANRSRAVSPVRSPLVSPPLTAPIGTSLEMRRLASDPVIEKQRAKSPRPPKASREESAYLRKDLGGRAPIDSQSFHSIPPSAQC